MMRSLHQQVKFIKDNHMNMQEEKEKQEAAKKAKEMRQLIAEANDMVNDFWVWNNRLETAEKLTYFKAWV